MATHRFVHTSPTDYQASTLARSSFALPALAFYRKELITSRNTLGD
jgi:hypothetical protein